MTARLRMAALVALLVVAGVGCEVRTEVDVRVEETGAGAVEVSVTLDREAVAKAGDLAAQLRTDDLEATGWEVDGPTSVDDGGQRITALKRFTTPGQLADVVAELTGDQGPFLDLSLVRSHQFGRTTYRVTGVADLSRGLESFGDQRLREALGGPMFGQPVEALEAQAGRPLAEAAPFAVTVRLPGAAPRSFAPVLGGEPVPVRAEVSTRSDAAFGLAAAAGGIGLVAIVLAGLLATGWLGGGRRRSKETVTPPS